MIGGNTTKLAVDTFIDRIGQRRQQAKLVMMGSEEWELWMRFGDPKTELVGIGPKAKMQLGLTAYHPRGEVTYLGIPVHVRPTWSGVLVSSERRGG